MPYINPLIREFKKTFNPVSPGELNYCITKIIDKYIKENGLNYRSINDVVGVLECSKLELYRRVVVPYEDLKKHDNGDVYSKENLIDEK